MIGSHIICDNFEQTTTCWEHPYIFGSKCLRATYNEMKLILKSEKVKRLMGLKIHQDGSKPTNSLEWLSVVASMR